VLYDLDDEELDALNAMIGEGAGVEEIRGWLDQLADELLWQDQMDFDELDCCRTHDGPHVHGCRLPGDHPGQCHVPTRQEN
jgi:hypothetical protein